MQRKNGVKIALAKNFFISQLQNTSLLIIIISTAQKQKRKTNQINIPCLILPPNWSSKSPLTTSL